MGSYGQQTKRRIYKFRITDFTRWIKSTSKYYAKRREEKRREEKRREEKRREEKRREAT
jgi:hypothetical protein